MEHFAGNDITRLFLGLGVLLLAAKLFAGWAERFRLPAVFGELLAGVVLGPTILGRLMPETTGFIFPQQGTGAAAFEAITTIAIAAFLLLAGLEIGLTEIRRQGKQILAASAGSFLVPFGFGLLIAGMFVKHAISPTSPVVFSLFFATALSITALPVITRILKDLGLLQSRIGTIVIAAASINDLIGWLMIAAILQLASSADISLLASGKTLLAVVLFPAAMLTFGRTVLVRFLIRAQNRPLSRRSVFVTVLALGCLAAAFTEWIGVHAVFGTFVLGLTLGDSHALKSEVIVEVERFVTLVLAPLFFAGIGLKVDFVAHFEWGLVISVLLVACLGKLLGAYAGARCAGVVSSEAWAIGYAMNARGAMEIVVGMIALKAGIISTSLFVALVVMAITTSLLAALAIRYIFRDVEHPIPSEIAVVQVWAGH